MPFPHDYNWAHLATLTIRLGRGSSFSPRASAMISFSWSLCGMKLKVKEQFAGRSSKCPTCKRPLIVPSLDKTLVAPKDQIDGAPSSVHQAGFDGGVTLVHARATSITKLSAPAKAAILIPYYLWANRGAGEMTVWLPTAATEKPCLLWGCSISEGGLERSRRKRAPSCSPRRHCSTPRSSVRRSGCSRRRTRWRRSRCRTDDFS